MGLVAALTIIWRALPAEYGPWNSVWKRFWRLSQTGVFEAFLDALAQLSTDGLKAAILAFNDQTNARPFVWTKTADEILNSIKQFCQ
jgi:transposase